jgi:hypothetical protein
MTDVINPATVKTTKTFSVSLDTVNKIKEMADFKDTFDATILRDAVDLLYSQVFPTQEQPVKGGQ